MRGGFRGPMVGLGLGMALSSACGTDDAGRDAGADDGTVPGQTDAGTQSGRDEAGAGIPCAVQAALAEHCLHCHGASPQYGASVSLASYADFHAASAIEAPLRRHEAALARVTSDDPTNQMPPTSQPAMPEADRQLLSTWLAAGAPSSDERCDSDSDSDAGTDDLAVNTAGLACHKLVAHGEGDLNAPYAVGVARDRYVNFSFKAPWDDSESAYAVVSRPVIDNAKVLHHWLLFKESSGVQDGAVASSSGSHPTGELVHGWAPGGTTLDLRKHGNVAFEFERGSGFVVELHYNSDDANALDASGVEICLQDQAPEHVAGISWLGTDLLSGTSSSGTCTPRTPQEIHIIGISPHMHLQGRHMKAVIHRAGGADETLHDAPFAFEDQAWYERVAVLQPGDTISTRCDYATSVSFGTGTEDEMCYLFTVAYPKGALSDGRTFGTLAHGAGACLGL